MKNNFQLDTRTWWKQYFNFSIDYPQVLTQFHSNEMMMTAFGTMIGYLRELKLDRELITSKMKSSSDNYQSNQNQIESIINFLFQTVKRFSIFDPLQQTSCLVIDGQTMQNLEIIENKEKGSKGCIELTSLSLGFDISDIFFFGFLRNSPCSSRSLCHTFWKKTLSTMDLSPTYRHLFDQSTLECCRRFFQKFGYQISFYFSARKRFFNDKSFFEKSKCLIRSEGSTYHLPKRSSRSGKNLVSNPCIQLPHFGFQKVIGRLQRSCHANQTVEVGNT